MANVQNLDLNFATAEELSVAEIEGFSAPLARALVAYRDENGPLETWDEITNIPGFDEGLVEKLKGSGMILSVLGDQSPDPDSV
jgi:competence protein ComEA